MREKLDEVVKEIREMGEASHTRSWRTPRHRWKLRRRRPATGRRRPWGAALCLGCRRGEREREWGGEKISERERWGIKWSGGESFGLRRRIVQTL